MPQFTDEVASPDRECEEAIFQLLLKEQSDWTRDEFRDHLDETEVTVVRGLWTRRKEIPCVSRSWVRWLTISNAFRLLLPDTKKEQFPFPAPNHHDPPFSLAHLESWYKYTHPDEPGGEGEENDGDVVRTVKAGALDQALSDSEDMGFLWQRMMKDEVAPGLAPFEIILPASRDLANIFGDLQAETLKDCLGWAAGNLGSYDFALTLNVGDETRPTTLALGVIWSRPISDSFFHVRLAQSWEIFCRFGLSLLNGDQYLPDFVQQCGEAILHNSYAPLRAARAEYSALKEAWDKLQPGNDSQRHLNQLREAAKKSKRMKILVAAQEEEMDRLADEAWFAMLKDGADDISFDEKLAKLSLFVKDGYSESHLSRRSARALVAERIHRKLVVDLVKEIVAPESATTTQQQDEGENRVAAFVMEGDTRLSSLRDAADRLKLVEQAWVPLKQGSGEDSSQLSIDFLKQLRVDVETLLGEVVSRRAKQERKDWKEKTQWQNHGGELREKILAGLTQDDESESSESFQNEAFSRLSLADDPHSTWG
ncbi:hypothetical protein ABKA04_002315 [Annulohypoxylon sp. FPYF3050]